LSKNEEKYGKIGIDHPGSLGIVRTHHLDVPE